MGMDVFGREPSAKVGEYFRNSVWSWRPLAELCQTLAPEICDACEHWQSNDGDGLNDLGAMALATVLEKRLADGTVERFVKERDRRLAGLPDERCLHCRGTGKRNDEYVKGTCNGCEGSGKVRPFETWYDCTVENVTNFAAFLKASGGFNIH